MSAEYLIGIGGQKCASTWLFDTLARYPGVRPAASKELDFFSYHHDRGHAWYAAQWHGPGLRLECSPSYLHDPRAPDRLRGFAPAARVFAILRDPVERAYSHHLHEIARGHIPPRPFMQALPENPDYIAQGHYARHLSRWCSAFPPEQRLILLQEEVFADPLAALARLAQFIGRPAPVLDATIRAPKNVSDQPRSKLLRQGLRGCGRMARSLGMEGAVTALKSVPPVRQVMAWNDRPIRALIHPLTEAERKVLASHFNADMEQLAGMLGRDSLPWRSWNLRHGGTAAGVGIAARA